MGYETKMFVCAERGWMGESYRHGELLAMIDLCKCGYGESAVGRLIAKHTKIANEEIKKWCLSGFSLDFEENNVTKDLYGDCLGVIPINDMIDALDEEHKKDKYRRFLWASQLLKSIRDTWHDKSVLKVITYGN